MSKLEPVTPPPYAPAQLDASVGAAIKALEAGEATADQQRKALQWIIMECCDTYGLGWHPDGDHASSFMAGRRFAGLQIVKALKVQQGVLLKKKESEHG